VIGKKLPAARAAIVRGHCRVGKVRSARSTQASGRVIGQSRRPGAVLLRGSVVNLVLARHIFVRPPFTG